MKSQVILFFLHFKIYFFIKKSMKTYILQHYNKLWQIIIKKLVQKIIMGNKALEVRFNQIKNYSKNVFNIWETKKKLLLLFKKLFILYHIQSCFYCREQ